MKNMFSTAWRNIRHQGWHSFVNIGGLVIAMTAVILILTWVQNELRFDSYHAGADRIYLVKNYLQDGDNEPSAWENSPYALHAAIEQTIPDVEKATHILRSQPNEIMIKVNDHTFNFEWAIFADRNWFDVFHYEFIEGNADQLFANPYSVAITRSKAKNIFGSTHITGKTVVIDTTNYIVAAVLEDNPLNSSFQFDVLLPMSAKLNTKARLDEANYWGNISHKTFVKLKPGVNPGQTAEKINALFRDKIDRLKVSPVLLPLRQLHFDNDFKWSAFEHGNFKNVAIFIGLAVLLLLGAAINYVNLSVARASLRMKEIGVRKIIGAGRKHLFLQLMSESFLTSLIALAVTIVLVNVCLPYFNRFTGIHFVFDITAPPVAFLLAGILVTILLLTGIYPAILLSSFNPINLFRGVGFVQGKKISLRKGLIVTQFAFAIMMTIGAIVIYKQMQYIQLETGYNRKQVICLRTPEKIIMKMLNKKLDLLTPVKTDLLSISQVQGVSRANINSLVNYPYDISGGLDWEGRDPSFNPAYTSFSADSDLNRIMDLEFVQGHWFTENTNGDVILNETAVKQFGLSAPVIGKRFKEGRIIGIVRDFYYTSMHEKIGPVVISQNAMPVVSLLVSIHPEGATPVLKAAEAAWKKHFPGEPFIYSFMDDEFEKLYRKERKASLFTMVFSGLGIFISCIGLLALVALVAARRKKEIGIRKVLGAGVGDIVALVSKDFIRLIMIALLIASPVAWYVMHRWLEDFAYRIEIKGWMFGVAGLITVFIALVTLGYQSIKAALSNPVKSLRTD